MFFMSVSVQIAEESSIFLSSPEKGIVHPKMKILPSFTHPHVVPNLYEFIPSVDNKN